MLDFLQITTLWFTFISNTLGGLYNTFLGIDEIINPPMNSVVITLEQSQSETHKTAVTASELLVTLPH